MRCDRCGRLNFPDSVRCTECGAALEKPVPEVKRSPEEEEKAGRVGIDLGKRKDSPGHVEPAGSEIGRCSLCHGVFGPGELFKTGGRTICEHCLPRAETLHEAASTAAPPAGDRKGKQYLKQQVIAERLRREGRTASYQSVTWPKCARHPDRSTKDSCELCKKPICAMCVRRRGSRLYCPECVGKASGISSRLTSGKFGGFTGSYFETVKEVLFQPGIFFRNIPTRGEVFRPFLFALFNLIPGNGVLLLVISFFLFRSRGVTLGIEMIHTDLLRPLLYGVPILSVGFAALGWLPFHVISRLLGGKAPMEKGFRMFCLASAYNILNIIPFAGAAVAPLFATVILIRAVSEVYKLDIIRAFFVFLLSFGILFGGAFAFARFFIFADL